MKINMSNKREVQRNLDKMQDIIRTGLPDRIFVKLYRNAMIRALGQVSRENKDYMRNYLTTPTGQERKKKGGRYAGRSETDRMVKAYGVNKQTGSYKSGKYVFRLGWNRTAPEYTLFQEYGTRNGITGMNILRDTKQNMEDILMDLRSKSRGRFNLFRDIGDEPIEKIRHSKPLQLPPTDYQED